MAQRFIVVEFHGIGDRMDDRVLGKYGAFLTRSHSRDDYETFGSEDEALKAGEVAVNRRAKGKLLSVPSGRWR